MTPVGAARSLLLLLGVWWSWNDTAWFTNYFDPDRLPIQLVPVVLMLAGSPMSGSLP
jgi:low temperature requirement protein LtrA